MKITNVRNYIAGIIMAAGSLITAPLVAAEEIRTKQESSQRSVQLEAFEHKLENLEKRL